jgi:hypothetical protein
MDKNSTQRIALDVYDMYQRSDMDEFRKRMEDAYDLSELDFIELLYLIIPIVEGSSG